MQTLLFKILTYESNIFEKYQKDRMVFRESLEKIDTNTLSQESLGNLINDIKDIIDPIKISNEAINNYFENKLLSFQNNNSSLSNQELLKFIIFYNLIKS